MKAFLVNFLVVGEFLLADSFHIFSGQKPGGGRAARNLGFRRISARGNWMGKLLFCAVFIYLFIDCLFVCLLFIYFKGAVCWVMYQLCDLAPLDRGSRGVGVLVAISVEFCGDFGGLTLTYCVLLWV